MRRERTKALFVGVWLAATVAVATIAPRFVAGDSGGQQKCSETASTVSGRESNVDVDLRFVLEPEDAVVPLRSVVVLNCSVAGSNESRVEYIWRRNGETIAPDGRRVSMSSTDGQLTIRNFSQEHSDEGSYECVTKSGTSALVSRRARLQVALLGQFSGHPISSVVRLGENARFECRIDGVPKPNVTWRKNGEPLLPLERYTQLPFSVLQIVNATASDAGSYSCHAESLGQQRTSNAALLTVNSGVETPRHILGRPKDLEVEVGGTAVLECFPSHAVSSVIWIKKDGALTTLRGNRIRTFGLGNLEIRDLQESDAGNYSCDVRGHASLCGEVVLTVIVPPRLLFSSKEEGAQTFWLSCQFAGVPKPVVSWLKNGRPVRTYGRIKVQGDTLVIGQSTDSDSALYQCWAENQGGRDGSIVPLIIRSSENNPAPPSGLRTRALDNRRIELTWDPSPEEDSEHPIVAYSAHYWPLLGGEETQQVVRLPPATITKLQPYTNYTFYVRAYNKCGASEHSQYVIQSTEEDVPVVAPKIHVFPSSATSLQVTWTELSPQDARGAVVQHRIYYKKQDDPAIEVTVPGNVFEYEITGLETDENYSVRVASGTKAGFPNLNDDQWPWLSRTVAVDLADRVGGLPNLRMHAVNSTTIHLTWDTPRSLGPELLGFKIHYNLVGESPKTIVLIEEDTEHILFGLRPNSVYEISIGTFTDYGDGELYQQTILTPPAVVDSTTSNVCKPPVVSVTPVNETAMLVSWSVSTEEAYRISHYTVLCMTSSAAADVNTRTREIIANRTTFRLTITGLQPNTEYQVAVRSHSAACGPGPFSPWVARSTDEGYPPAILDLTWFLQEPTVVQLNWKLPPHTNGIISQYVVSYCEDKFAANHPWQTQLENSSLCYTVLHGLKSRTTYQVRLYAKNRKGPGPSSDIKVMTGMLGDSDEGGANDRLMGIIIGIGISGGCVIICVFIILLRNRFFPPPSSPPSSGVMHHANGFTTPLRCNGYVQGHTDDKHNEPDGTTPMLTHSQETDNIDGKQEVSSPKRVNMWSSVENGRTSPKGNSTIVV